VRIVISGTHCSGKSTLVSDFLAAHRDYVHEPEPWEWLVEVYNERMSEEPDGAGFQRQLEVSVERLQTYRLGARVIAERCPLDFLAYILALDDLGRDRHALQLVEEAVELARLGMEHVDRLIVLPLNDADGIEVPESEDPELRDAMNDRLLDLIATNDYDLLGASLRVVEVQGGRTQRLAALERAIGLPR
jgi:hypothetical protein